MLGESIESIHLIRSSQSIYSHHHRELFSTLSIYHDYFQKANPATFNFSLASTICRLNSSVASEQSPNVATLYNTENNAYRPNISIAQSGIYFTIISTVSPPPLLLLLLLLPIDDNADPNHDDLIESKWVRLVLHSWRNSMPMERKS
mmetsp:Transcript_7774/g.17545  ORF Transcript_7774/g.17545 Transcript_7774/m.17545 type:complete len:147 (+) Transcript_7774:351-791(+)